MEFLRAIFGTNISLFILLNALLAIIFLALFSLKKMDRIKNLERQTRKLKDNLKEMDEQAKLIVKTDLELSQTQEELDKKITSLLALQNLSQALSSSLEEEKIFSNIKEEMIEDLGFGLCLIILKEDSKLITKASVGLEDKGKIKDILKLMEEKNFLNLFSKQRVLYHSNLPSWLNYFKKEIEIKSFMASAIQSKESILGVIVLGNYLEEKIPEGAREIVDILSTQIAQSLENIHLFEQLYNSQKELEDKVKQRTQDLQKALEEIRKVSRLKSEFVSAVSHEFRTPLTSIKGYASLLAGEKFGKLPQEIKLRLERINQQADTLVSMINDLLDIARIESGRMKIDIQRIDLVELIKRVGDYFYPQIREKNIQLILNLPLSLSIDADKRLIERVLMNLLSNATKFTPQGKNIEVGIEEENNFVKVNVKDEGIGILKEDLENIFREFYRADNPVNKEVRGTGLGLSLVRNIIKAHKGEIWAESKIGEGSNFIFTLPR